MATDRRTFLKTVSASGVALNALSTADCAVTPEDLSGIKGLAFDAYGTLFDVFSVTALCEQLFPGNGNALAQLWRAKQLQYSLLRSLMARYKDFWQLTEDGLVYASNSLKLNLSQENRQRLMDAYLSLAVFPDVKPGLEQLKKQGMRLALLSNGEPRMLAAVTRNAGITALLDEIISVDAVKIFKPSPRVYQLAQARMKMDVSRLGFVSSNSWDVNGAASVGLTTFWIQRSVAEPAEELGFAAKRVVGSLTELASVLQR